MSDQETPGPEHDSVPWETTEPSPKPTSQTPPSPPPPPPPAPPAPVPPAPTTASSSPWENPGAPQQTPVAAQPPALGNVIGSSQPPPAPPHTAPQTTPASTGMPVLSGAYGVTQPPAAPDAPAKSSKLPWIAAVLGAFVLLGGGGFFALTAFSASGGADSPEAAVDAMIEALGNEDFVTIGELIEPSERRTIVEPTITDVLPELVRLGVLSNDIDAANVEGVDWEFTDVTYRVEPLAQNPDIVHVYFTGGEVVSEFNAAEFPFSDLLRDEMGSDLESQERQTDTIEESETPLTFVQRDGRWYFSGWFSVAEAARLDAGERLPRASEAPPALGSQSPEAAVEAMFEEMMQWDLEGLIGRMDPDEMAVLYRYSPLFLDDAQGRLEEVEADLRANNYTWGMRDFDFDVETDGDDAVVVVRGFTFDLKADDVEVSITYSRDELASSVIADDFGGRGTLSATTTRWEIEGVIEGEEFNLLIEVDPEAYTITGSGNAAGETAQGQITFDQDDVCSRYSFSVSDGTEESGCLEDSLASDQDEAVIAFYKNSFDEWPTEFPGISMSARRTDGEWYVSPIGTTFAGYLSVLQAFEDDQLEEMLSAVNDLDALSTVNDVLDETIGNNALTSPTDELDDLFADIDDEALFDDSFEDAVDDEDFESFGDVDGVQESEIALVIDRGAVGELDDSIEPGAYDLATIDLDAGDTVIVTVQTDPSSFLDTTLTMVNNASGAEVGFNDDADVSANLASALDSQLEVTVSESGSYSIEIGSFGYTSGGEYSLTVERR